MFLLNSIENEGNHHFLLQFYVAYIVTLLLALFGVWILNITLYILVKKSGSVMEYSRRNLPALSNCNRTANETTSTRGNVRTRRWWHLPGWKNTHCHSNNRNLQQDCGHHRRFRRKLELKLAKTVRYVVIAFSCVLVPCLISLGEGGFSYDGLLDPCDSVYNAIAVAATVGFNYVTTRLLLCNSFANCIIYSYRSNDFRSVLKMVLLSMIRKRCTN